jgi:nitrite reductase/ring-hydroxylating ferredoxin subunit
MTEKHNSWTRVCALNALPEQATKGVEFADQEVILINWFGKIYAYLNNCPHAGWPLNFDPDKFLDEEGRYLQCSNHMALFEVEDGSCIAGPCPGQKLTPIEVSVMEGDIFLGKLPD